jgi:NTE family protein
VAGAWLTSGLPIADFSENLLHQDRNPPLLGADERLLAQIYALIGKADTPLEPDDAREIGRLAIEAPTPAVRYMARRLPDTTWPKRLRAVVVNAHDGRVRVITQSDGVPLALGVAASCAAPGISAPISIQRQPYIDGGARSDTNADLLAGLDLARAIIVSPIPRTAKLIGEGVHRLLQEEMRRLRTSGVDPESMLPTEIEDDAFGADLFNLTKVPAAIEAGRRRGEKEAGRLNQLIMT